MYVDKEKVIQVIKEASQNGTEPPSADTLSQALKRHGLSPQAYKEALREDPTLEDLEKQSMTQAVTETPDPGPYDSISRESPSGQPGDLKKSRHVHEE